MATDLDRYRYELRRYKALKNSILEMLPLLEKTINTYEEISKSLSDVYMINGDTTSVYDESVRIKDKMNDTSNKLKNFIIPKINSKIYSLNRAISNYNANNAIL